MVRVGGWTAHDQGSGPLRRLRRHPERCPASRSAQGGVPVMSMVQQPQYAPLPYDLVLTSSPSPTRTTGEHRHQPCPSPHCGLAAPAYKLRYIVPRTSTV